MAVLNQFIDFDPIIDSLWEKFQPEIRNQLDQLRKEVVALLPIIGAGAAKAISDQFPVLIRGILEKDPDLPVLSNIFDLSELIRNGINDSALPIEIPFISDVLKSLGR
jgi:hypothetical protein